MAKVIFKLSDEGTGELLSGDTFCIVEKRSKKFGEVTTAYKILNAAGYQVLRPFSMFDRFVLAVCISEWIKGNRYTTVAINLSRFDGKNRQKRRQTERHSTKSHYRELKNSYESHR